MRKLTKHVPFSLAVLLAVVLVLVMTCSVLGGVALASDTPTPIANGNLSIGHMSDIHYFPLEYCYQNVYAADYKSSKFYHSTTGDTKLVIESGIALNAQVQQILKDADERKAPQYFLASGDLCKNGERVALIDVANTLRFLQNEMRSKAGYENFQVFVTTGNHDLYNHHGELYSQKDGSPFDTDMVTAAQFAMIFAGLGFPDASLDGSHGFNLTAYMPEEYWSSTFTDGYVQSDNSNNLTITYYSNALQTVATANNDQAKLNAYFAVGDELDQLTYLAKVKNQDYAFAMFDSTDREAAKEGEGSLVKISKAEYDSLSEKPVLYSDSVNANGETIINTSRKYTSVDEVGALFNDASKGVYRRTDVQHITGGRVKTETLDWMEGELKKINAVTEQTVIASMHHNVLPHFEQEDDILKDFTLYNWEYTAKRFLNMGIRYVFSGHMHASDVMQYTDEEGRTLYDTETGSAISYASPRRYVKFERYSVAQNGEGNKLGETMTSSVHLLGDIREIASDKITSSAVWDDAAYKAAIAIYNANKTDANWQNVVDANPNFLTYTIRYDEFNALASNGNADSMYNDFISGDIYAIIVDRFVDHFINQDTLDGFIPTIKGLFDKLPDLVYTLTGLDKETLEILVDYLADILFYNLYPDTDGDGLADYPTVEGQPAAHTTVEYVLNVVNDLLDQTYGDETLASRNNPTNAGKLKLREIASFIMMSHSAGNEISLSETYESIDRDFVDGAPYGELYYRYKQPTDRTYRKRMLAAIKDAHEQLVDGRFAGMLINKLLDALYRNENSLLKTLIEYKFDLSKADWDDSKIDYDENDNEVPAQYLAIKNLLGPKLSELKGIIASYMESLEIDVDLSSLTLSYDATKFCLGDVIGDLLPILKNVLGNAIGFNMVGNSLYEIVDNAINGYITPSFLVGLGGIADNIVMAFATDIRPDLKTMNDPAEDFVITPHNGYSVGGVHFSYLSSLNKVSEVGAAFNGATQDNGRVPSRVTTAFDTQNGTTAYTFKFYTGEDVYGTFKFKTSENGAWNVLSTSRSTANPQTDFFDSYSEQTFGGIKVAMLTQTKPAYVPLIDLGLACLTHGTVVLDKDEYKDNPYTLKYGDRDKSAGNSVIYWNVTTVTVTGLSPDTTYYYDLAGSYVNESVSTEFSFVDFNKKVKGYNKDYFTFKTAADKNKTSFEFLTIADIQGMIQGMYDSSYEAVTALLNDSRTNNFDFILNAGDMCDNGKNFNQWAMALDTYQQLFANSSLFFTAGNHESGTNAMTNFFSYTLPTLPKDSEGNQLQQNTKDGVFYSFDYGNAHFTVLNTNDASNDGLGAVQLEWLKNDLKSTSAKWKFVLMHKSLYSGGSHSTDGEVVAMRKQLTPLFAENGVSIVFAGHDHTYTTTELIDKNGKTHDLGVGGWEYTGDGVMYVTLGTMGTKFYNYQENPDVTPKFDKDNSILKTLETQTFGKVSVNGNKIVYTAYQYDRNTKTLTVIGESKLGQSNLVLATCLGVIIPVVVIAAVVATLLILKKKGILFKKKEAVAADNDVVIDDDADVANKNNDDSEG